jgi:hypothetical protein
MLFAASQPMFPKLIDYFIRALDANVEAFADKSLRAKCRKICILRPSQKKVGPLDGEMIT